MKTLTSTAIVALTAGIIGVTAIMPAASAQQVQPARPQAGEHMRQHLQQRPGMGQFQMRHDAGPAQRMRGGPGGPGGLVSLVCSERGAEQLEVAFVRLSHRVELTDDQQNLFDDLKTTALVAQTQFAESCASARPTSSSDAGTRAAPDPVAGMKAMIAHDSARVAALEAVLPKLDAFFSSLTDEQKASFAPQRGKGDNARRLGQRMHQGMARPGMQAPAGAPAAPDASKS